jgi:hypothetical protein
MIRSMFPAMLPALAALSLFACSTDEDLRTRHGSPLHIYKCADGKSFEARQIISGEVEVTAGGRTRDVTDAKGDPIPNGPSMTTASENSRLTGMPGGPYESCVLDDRNAE